MLKKIVLFLLLFLIVGTLFYFSVFHSYLNLPKLVTPKNVPKGEVVAAATTSNTVWDPALLNLNSTTPPPVLSAKAALAAEITTNKIIFSKNQHLKLPVGSLQKIVTAMVAVDNLKEDSITTVSANASSREPDSMGLFPGEKLTLKQLLYGLLLVSGNDSATAIAEAVAGDEANFAKMMTNKAKSLGLQNSQFINANGLDEGYQYSTAFDLATLAINLEKNYPLLAEIVATKEYLVPNIVNEVENHKEYYLKNSSPLLDLDGYLGIKPGFTPEAEWCLLTLVARGNEQYLIVVLGSEDRKGDSLALLDYLTQNYP